MQLNIYKETSTRIPVQAIRRLFAEIAKNEASPTWQAQVNLVFTTNRRIQRLNQEYRDKDKPTDVLSFEIDTPEQSGATFGEVYISVQTATRQARELGHSLSNEYLRLACHGFMHLFGYDHQEDGEAEEMEAREMKYLQAIRGTRA